MPSFIMLYTRCLTLRKKSSNATTMVSTCMSCRSPNANLKKCSECSRAWCCLKVGQKNNWVCHIFGCSPRRDINMADYLAPAVRKTSLFRRTPDFDGLWGYHIQRSIVSVWVVYWIHPNYQGQTSSGSVTSGD